MDQLMHPEEFVNSGFVHSYFDRLADLKWKQIHMTLLTNEQATLCIQEDEVISTYKIGTGIQGRFATSASKEPAATDNIVRSVFRTDLNQKVSAAIQAKGRKSLSRCCAKGRSWS